MVRKDYSGGGAVRGYADGGALDDDDGFRVNSPKDDLSQQLARPHGSVSAYDPPWYKKIPYALTDAVGGGRDAHQWMDKLFGTQSPLNIPGSIHEGVDKAHQGYKLVGGDYDDLGKRMMMEGGTQAGLGVAGAAGLDRAAFRPAAIDRAIVSDLVAQRARVPRMPSNVEIRL